VIRKNNKGFTLVELLAVIVILAIILVIAVPKIMNTINDATKASFESSAKMVAAQVENQYTVAKTLNKTFGETGNCMQEWAGLNENDYASCKYEITNDGEAKVTLEGKNKFKNSIKPFLSFNHFLDTLNLLNQINYHQNPIQYHLSYLQSFFLLFFHL